MSSDWLFLVDSGWSIPPGSNKAAFPLGIAAFCFASQSIESPGIFGAERGMSVLEEDYLHKFASERFALASATERLFCLSMQSDAPVKHRVLSVSEFARMADNRRANRNSKRNESSSSTGMLFLQKENQDPCKDPGDFRAVLMRQPLLLTFLFYWLCSGCTEKSFQLFLQGLIHFLEYSICRFLFRFGLHLEVYHFRESNLFS